MEKAGGVRGMMVRGMGKEAQWTAHRPLFVNCLLELFPCPTFPCKSFLHPSLRALTQERIMEKAGGVRGMMGRGMGKEAQWTAHRPLFVNCLLELFPCPTFSCKSFLHPSLRALTQERIMEKAGGVRGMMVRGMGKES
jgi:hypothetical protein